ncbi:MAG: phosphate starvation-inducible protein PsiF [Betaproteobacteria bacterium]|nr:phosphate starvation-inducible protein PsiF [Betaproteobacteria bacterium]
MKNLTKAVIAAMSLAFASTAVQAEDKAPTKQQSKFGACSKEAKEKGLKGDERKAFMKSCAKKGKGDAKPAEKK